MKNKPILMVGSVPPPIGGQPIAFKGLIDNLSYKKIIINQINEKRFFRPLKMAVHSIAFPWLGTSHWLPLQKWAGMGVHPCPWD